MNYLFFLICLLMVGISAWMSIKNGYTPIDIMFLFVMVGMCILSQPSIHTTDEFKVVSSQKILLEPDRIIQGEDTCDVYAMYEKEFGEKTIYCHYRDEWQNENKIELLANRSKVIYDESESPYVILYSVIRYDKTPNWFQKAFYRQRRWDRMCTKKCRNYGEIHIPENNILVIGK